MDASVMDAEGGRVHHLERRARRMVVIVALQNLLVAACLLLTLYAYCVQEPESTAVDDYNIHINLESIADIKGNTTLQFNSVQSSKMMSLVGKGDKIYINCTGPYILYIDVCYLSMTSGMESRGTLQLQGIWSKTPLISFPMNSSSDKCTRSGLQSTVYLRVGEASLYLKSTVHFKLKHVTVGLSNLLGRQCQY